MDYEQKYREALEMAKKELQEFKNKDCDDTTRKTAITIIHNLFPELKESEDERIRREILEYINSYANLKDEKIPTEWLEWLEKQGRSDKVENAALPDVPVTERIRDSIALVLTDVDESVLFNRGVTLKAALDWLEKQGEKKNTPKKEIDDAYLQGVCDAKYEIEKQGEQIELKKVEQDNCPRLVMADFNGGDGFYKLNLENLSKEQVDAIEMIITNPKQNLNINEVIDWLERNSSMFWESPCNPSKIVNYFKKDFGL